jgi:hypothetical protein
MIQNVKDDRLYIYKHYLTEFRTSYITNSNESREPTLENNKSDSSFASAEVSRNLFRSHSPGCDSSGCRLQAMRLRIMLVKIIKASDDLRGNAGTRELTVYRISNISALHGIVKRKFFKKLTFWNNAESSNARRVIRANIMLPVLVSRKRVTALESWFDWYH